MKYLIFILSIFLIQSCAITKSNYLKKNRLDLTKQNFVFPQKNFKILGFGAYHGSAKTEITEYALLKSLTKNGIVKHYLPETDYSIGHFFNQYLKTGDTLLLKDLVETYGVRVPQDKSIETYEKWKKIRNLNNDLPEINKITVVGIDLLVTYKYTSKHLLEILNIEQNKEKSLQRIVNMVKLDTTDFSPYYDSYSKNILQNFIKDYEANPMKFEKHIKNNIVFDHLIKNLKYTFEKSEREKIIYNNYIDLSKLYDFNNKPQFLRFGFGHLEKIREHNYPSFLTRLIEKGIYKSNEVISVIGYLTESRVLWDINYDEKGKYKDYTTKGGFGIGDYEKEYFRGIDKLKERKISDITLFQLNKVKSPYNKKVPDLIEVIMEGEKSNGKYVKGKSTTEFIDYAILISNSKANTPIYEIKK